MSNQPPSIPQLIERLDHPDATHQDSVLEQLSDRSDEARPVIWEQFSRVNARIRRALLRWLSNEATRKATLPLMRYIFDERDTVADQTGRSMAMAILFRRARSTDRPEERGRLRAFAEDMCDDSNPEIRRLAIRILGYVGDRRSAQQIESQRDDAHEDVRQAAKRALRALDEAPESVEAPTDDPDQLCRRLLQSAGPRRRQLIRRWKRHDQRASIAVEILRRENELRSQALQLLLNDPRPSARPLLASIVLEDPDAELAALSLRLLARLATSRREQPDPDELEAIRRALDSDDLFSRGAACRCVEAFGLGQFVRPLIEMTESRHLPVALDASRSLDGLLDHTHQELLRHLEEALRGNERRRRRHDDDPDCIRIVAHMMSALRDVVSSSTIGVERLRRVVFDILASGGEHRSLRVTGLQLLLASTPQHQLETYRRFSDQEVTILVELIPHCQRQALRRIGRLLWRGAPANARRLDEAAHRLWTSDSVDVDDIVVPLFDRAGTKRADDALSQIADGEPPAAAEAARAVFRRRRNESEFIDVDFTPRDDLD